MPHFAVIAYDDQSRPWLEYILDDLNSCEDLMRDEEGCEPGERREVWKLSSGWNAAVKVDDSGIPLDDGTILSDHKAAKRLLPWMRERMAEYATRLESAP